MPTPKRPPAPAVSEPTVPPSTDPAVSLTEALAHGPGRMSARDAARAARVVDAIRAGNYHETACRVAGVDAATFEEWCMRGEEQEAGAYRRFLDAVIAAEGEAEAEIVERVRDASKLPQYWAAGATWLERRHSARWKRQEASVSGSAVTINVGIALPGTRAGAGALPAGYDVVTVVPELDE